MRNPADSIGGLCGCSRTIVSPIISPSGWPGVLSERKPGSRSSFAATVSSIGSASNWLKSTPYDGVARRVISETGLWTDHPAANYITAAMADGQLDENKLAGRTVRAFLGQRIDCAQCHDHPFAEWKQGQFEGLAALFGQATARSSAWKTSPR